jgi:predicted XRE-type DNA-binding protein
MTMHAAKLKKLEAAGWKAGSAAEFLELSPEEATLIDIKLSLSVRLKKLRQENHMSQAVVAKAIGSSQSRVAKAEAGDASVSLDLIVRSLLAVGASSKYIAEAITPSAAKRKVSVKRKVSAKKAKSLEDAA